MLRLVCAFACAVLLAGCELAVAADVRVDPYAVIEGRVKYYEVFQFADGTILRNLLLRNPQPWFQHVGWIILSVAVFIGLIVVGLLGNAGAFKGLVFVMGLGTGLAGAGMLSGVVSFTTPIRAGMLMGVWGVANMVGHAFGNLMGGTIVDVMRLTTGTALVAYSTQFGLEAVILLVALYLSTRLDMNASQASLEESELVSAATSAD